MSETVENIRASNLPPPEISVLMEGSGVVETAWSYTRDFPFWVLYHNRTEGANLVFGDQTEIRPDGKMILLIPPHTKFRSKCERAFRHTFLHFLAGNPYSGIGPGEIVLNAAPYKRLLGYLESGTPEEARHASYALIGSVLLEVPRERFSKGDETDRKIQAALPLLGGKRSIGEIARRTGMSRSSFEHLFKERMRTSPGRYALSLRLEKARWMLENTDLPMGEIAESAGFSDRFSFSKAFRKYAGAAPGKIRRSGVGPSRKA